ncbi:MAG: DNA mismatch repair protein MutS [Proteobacteria bacterium]|nr:DNA mismatch repair protein MutS [Pseudomonadota bacterium]NIS68143.1 DNA mismatch repair protein MutS [Pseudomonadota bacterium]
MPARTPMIEQYLRVKSEYPDAILFYRMGDFYEMFFEDAKVASRELEITLTSRNKGNEESAPLCGVPYHAADSYIAKLIERGYKVAICEQTEDPKQAKGLVKREVVRVITPGTVVDSDYLEAKSNNYLMAISPNDSRFGVALLDLSTGEFRAFQVEDLGSLITEAARNDPQEIILPESFQQSPQFDSFKRSMGERFVNILSNAYFDRRGARRCLEEQYQSIQGTRLDEPHAEEALVAAGAVLRYIRENDRSTLAHLKTIDCFQVRNYMVVDETTRRNLELTESLVEGKVRGSLLGVLDVTVTAMGARALKHWLLYPLMDLREIKRRLDAVEEFVEKKMERHEIREPLKEVYDLERLNTRIAMARANGRDLVALKASIYRFPDIKRVLQAFEAPLLGEIFAALDDLQDVGRIIEESIRDDAPPTIKEGGIIKDGYNSELDGLRQVIREGKTWIARLEKEERERTGINSLKVRFNQVFGYYIEITKTHLNRVPDDYIRKQTLTNAERFITPRLKEYESRVLGAEEKITRLEYKLFDEIRSTVFMENRRIQQTASSLGDLDVLATFAEVADQNSYRRPSLNDETAVSIQGGRHPVVEQLRPSEVFVPNDVLCDCEENQLLVITGPNMAGKSTFLRQVALIVLMAQMGSFVPAESAAVGVVDRIFTRVGASDNIVRGQSTFMVEMMEAARILSEATPRSLVILDEIGRGTSTFDGLSIAWAVAEFIHDEPNLGAKTLFATHYHELTELALTKKRVKNFNFAVREWNDEVIFLRRIVPGSASRSYGIQVARLAGLPQEVIERAKEILGNLEKGELTKGGVPRLAVRPGETAGPGQLDLFSAEDEWIRTELRRISIDTMSPIEAMNKLYELKKRVDEAS